MFFKSLFSYDRYPNGEIFFFILMKHLVKRATLKGHQIIGELRLISLASLVQSTQLKGHQIIGELRLIFIGFFIGQKIEGAPDHW